MKKAAGVLLKIFLGLVLTVLILMFSIPLMFRDKIKAKVEQVINESVNAKVNFSDYKLGFFKNFPNLTFSLDNVSVAGIDKFKTDTLASFNSMNLVFNLSSLFKSSGYEIKSVIINDANVKAIVLKDGTANWDIMKESATPEAGEKTTSSGMKFLLKNIDVLNSSVSYLDYSTDMQVFLNKLNSNIKGDMTLSETNLAMTINVGDVTFVMEGMKYLNKVTADSKINLLANLDSMKFTFKDNYLSVNDLKLNFAGMVAMPGDDIKTDLTFNGEKISLKSIMSLVPAVYMKDFKDLKTSGEVTLSGSAKGVYSDADSTMPDISLNFEVNDGLISYPSLPEKINNINIKSNLFVDGKDMDKTTVNVDGFHMELAGNPFDMTFALKTPISDPDIKVSAVGQIDLSSLSKAVPMDSINLSGIIDMSVHMAGRLSMIEKKQYESFKATGTMNIKNMLVAMIGYPEVKINEAGFEFTPAYATMNNTSLNIGGKSDFTLNGRIENYIPYILSDKTLKGNLSLHSKMTDASEIMSKLISDTTVVEDTTSLAVIQVPRNIDFDFNALIDKFSYDNIKAQQVKGHIIVRDGVMSLRETGMNILNGTVLMNADYDTRDTLKPVMKADFKMKNIAVKEAFNTFNTVQKLAPAAKNIDGDISAELNYESLLAKDMMPVINSIKGSGKLQSDEITLLKSETFDKMKGILKLGDKYNNTFKNINISFKIADGRIYLSPFDVKTGNLKMNINGDQGIDQTMNYIIKTEIPKSDLGSSVNSLIDNLSAQASAFGITFKPSEVIRVNVKVSGTFSKPVVSPFFGSTSSDNTSGVKETAKAAVSQTIDATVDKAKEKAKSAAEAEGDKLVKEAEDKGRQLRDEATKAAEKIRQEAALKAQKLVKEAESKGTLAKVAAQKAADSVNKEADKKANQLVKEADEKALKLVEEAKSKRQELLDNI